MAVQTMPHPEKLSQSSGGGEDYRNLETQLGDGQQQIAPDGLNSVTKTFSARWRGLTLVELTAIRAVISAAGGYDIITHTITGDTTPTNLRSVGSLSWATQGGDVYSCDVNFIEDHRP